MLDLSILAWFLAQLIKTVANLVVNRNLDLKRMVGSGDMPQLPLLLHLRGYGVHRADLRLAGAPVLPGGGGGPGGDVRRL